MPFYDDSTSINRSILINKLTELPKKSGDVVVITGGLRGIGLEVIRMLLECDMMVVVGKFDRLEIVSSLRVGIIKR